jgi:hypothetical protein
MMLSHIMTHDHKTGDGTQLHAGTSLGAAAPAAARDNHSIPARKLLHAERTLTWYASPEQILLTPFAGLIALPFALFVTVKATVLHGQQHTSCCQHANAASWHVAVPSDCLRYCR